YAAPRNAAATYPPSPARSRAWPRPACCPDHPRRPTRSSTATPATAPTSPAATSAAADPAHPRPTPTRPSAAPSAPPTESTTYPTDPRRTTLGEHADGLAGQPGDDILDRVGVEDPVSVERDVADVRGEHRARRGAKRVVGRQRLHVEHVEAGAGDPAGAQRLDQRGLVDDRAAGGVDQVAVRTDQVQLAGAEQAPGAVGQLEVDGDHVRAGQQVVQGDRLHAELAGVAGVEVRAPGEHPHPERPAVAGDDAAEPAEPEHAERPAGQLRADRGLPAA